MERRCELCYYSKPSMNGDLVMCSYMDDIMHFGKILDSKEEWRTARYFSEFTNFSGNAYEAYVDFGDEKLLKICVGKNDLCGKFVLET